MSSLGLTRWRQVLADPLFRDIPYKVETNKNGMILMSPASNWHGSAQSQVAVLLSKGRKGGEIIVECSILTSDGVKVADVAWASEVFMATYGYKTPYPVAPEICVEVVSPGNAAVEIDKKIDLYLAKGAQEVWVVEQDATVRYHSKTGAMRKSQMVKSVKLKKRA